MVMLHLSHNFVFLANTQLKLYLPADLKGGIALREEEAFWPSTGELDLLVN